PELRIYHRELDRMVFAASTCCRAVRPFVLFYHLRAYGPEHIAGLFSNPDASVSAPSGLAELSWLTGRREFDLGTLVDAVGHGGDADLSWSSLCRPTRLVPAEAGLSRAVVMAGHLTTQATSIHDIKTLLLSFHPVIV